MLAQMHWAPAHRRPSALQITIVVSLLLHAVALLDLWPPLFPKRSESTPGNTRDPIHVMLPPLSGARPKSAAAPEAATPPPPAPPPASQPAPQPAPKSAAREPKAAPAVRPARPPATSGAPPPSTRGPALLPPAEPSAQAPGTPAMDMSAMIEARRRARGEATPTPQTDTAPPVEDDIAHRNRIVAANMGTIRAPTLGNDIRRSGGVFSIRRLGTFDAEFVFYGWNKDVKRTMNQIVEVPIGNNPTIQLAVVRRMIAIIREHEQGDFGWESPRLKRVVQLSARLSDTAGLEDFFLREFF